MIKKAIQNYEADLAENAKRNPKLIYKYIKSKQKVKESIRFIKSECREMLLDRTKIANELNSYFHSVFINEPELTDNRIPNFQLRTN